MTPSKWPVQIDWNDIRYFSPSENWGDISRIAPALVYKLDALRAFIKKPIIINRAFVLNHPREHGFGLAADITIPDLHIVEQYLAAERFDFGGIGVYPDGLHLDVRLTPSRWGSSILNEERIYVKLDRKFLKNL